LCDFIGRAKNLKIAAEFIVEHPWKEERVLAGKEIGLFGWQNSRLSTRSKSPCTSKTGKPR
jgi:hypothetical protein